MIYGFNAGEVFQIGIELEENGRRFYEKAREKAAEDEVQKVFASLEAAEVEHKKRFESLKADLPASAAGQTVWDPDNEIDQYLKMTADMHVFRSGPEVEAQLARVSDAVSALKLAIQFEKDSIVFFTALEGLAEDKESRGLIGQLVREELEHLKMLTLELRRLGA